MVSHDDAPLTVARRPEAPGKLALLTGSLMILVTGAAAGLILLATRAPRGGVVVALLALAAALSGVQGLLTD
jgi:hypothetical protein